MSYALILNMKETIVFINQQFYNQLLKNSALKKITSNLPL